MRTGDVSVEQFTFKFTNVTAAGATMTMAWDKARAAIDLRLVAGSK